MPFARLAATILLVLAAPLASATIAAAQTLAEEPVPPTLPARVEIGATAGVAVAFPEYGLIASLPLDQSAAIEVLVSRMPASWDGPAHILGQVQMRVPFREHLRSRKSFVVGLTSLNAVTGDDTFLGIDSGAFVRPHAGVSLQWPVAPTLGFRFDAQGIFTFVGEFPLLPRAVTAFVWHPRTRTANNGRTSR
jgi:hypothetical protein